jgi:hypothetical protein
MTFLRAVRAARCSSQDEHGRPTSYITIVSPCQRFTATDSSSASSFGKGTRVRDVSDFSGGWPRDLRRESQEGLTCRMDR